MRTAMRQGTIYLFGRYGMLVYMRMRRIGQIMKVLQIDGKENTKIPKLARIHFVSLITF